MDVLEELNYRVRHRIVSSTRLRGDNWDAMQRAASEIEALIRQNRELVTEVKVRDGVISDLQNLIAPEGYVLVPKDPTPGMLAAVADLPTIAASVWADMLAAARRQDI